VNNVLQLLLATVLERRIELAPYLPIGVVGYANAARLGDALKPSRNVDAIAKNIAFFDDDVADMNANAQFDPPIRRYIGVALAHPKLRFGCATHGVNGAGEFDQNSIAGPFHDAPAILGSRNSRRWAFSLANVPSSSAPISCMAACAGPKSYPLAVTFMSFMAAPSCSR
jgi:hypothetical protein